MAEQVQSILDAMVEPLANLQERNILSPSEVSSTVARRREFEYRLQRRRQLRLSDHLEYLATEEKLEQLRRVRMKKLKLVNVQPNENNDDAVTLQANLQGDRHILHHLHRLWNRTLARFGTTSVELYLQYASFCQRFQCYHNLSKDCYPRALAEHGRTHPELWVGAAQHEMMHNNAVGAARVLLQRGLRVVVGCDDDKCLELWRASFVLELHWVQKLRGRKSILLQGTDSSAMEEQKDVYKVAKIVFRNAMKAPEAQPKWGWELLRACQGFPAADLVSWILSQIVDENETDPEMWVCRAKYYATQSDDKTEQDTPASKRPRLDKTDSEPETTKNPVLDTIRQACSSIQTPEMYGKALEFLSAYDGDGDDEVEQVMEDLIMDVAESSHLQSEDLMLLYADSLTSSKKAIEVLSEYISRTEKCRAPVWIELARRVCKKEGPEAAEKVLKKASFPFDDSDSVTIHVQLLGLHLLRDQPKFSLLETILLLAPANPMAYCDRPVKDKFVHIPAICSAFLEQVNETTLGRKAYKAILGSHCWTTWVKEAPDAVQNIIDHALSLEADSAPRQRVIFDRAIESFKGTNVAKKYRQQRDGTVRFR